VDGTPIIMGFDQNSDDLIIQCREEKRDYFFIDHAYFDRGYEKGNFRVIKNGVHQSELKKAPESKRELSDWTKGSFVIVIPPPPKIAKVFGLNNWVEETVKEIRKYTDRRIFIKQKQSLLPLSFYLNGAHCVVSFASVSEVEAAISGVPVFVSKYSPAYPISGDITKIETPEYPERREWLSSLEASQFHTSQMESGEAWRQLNAI
jgi:hypothetical protein